MLEDESDISNQVQVLSTIDEKQIPISAEGKTTILYFFAPWCKICHTSISNLEKIYMKRQDIDVIAIALDYQDDAQIQAFVEDKQLSFPVALGDSQTKANFKITGYPSYYVIDENNLVEAKSLGYSTELGLHLRTL